MSAIQDLETRLSGLRSLLAKREAAAAGAYRHADPYAHSQNMNAANGPIPAIRKELNDVAIQYVNAKIAPAGGWDAFQVIERMTTPPEVRVIGREPSDMEISAAVRDLLSKVPDDATVASLKELLQ